MLAEAKAGGIIHKKIWIINFYFNLVSYISDEFAIVGLPLIFRAYFLYYCNISCDIQFKNSA